MKKTVMTALLGLSVLTPAMALAAGNCEPKDTQLSTVQRTAYIKLCLAESGSPANVQRVTQQHKKMSCEQNARNRQDQLHRQVPEPERGSRCTAVAQGK